MGGYREPGGEVERDWEVRIEGRVYRLSFDQLVEGIADGRLLRTDEVRRKGLDWLAAGRAPRLRDHFPEGSEVPATELPVDLRRPVLVRRTIAQVVLSLAGAGAVAFGVRGAWADGSWDGLDGFLVVAGAVLGGLALVALANDVVPKLLGAEPHVVAIHGHGVWVPEVCVCCLAPALDTLEVTAVKQVTRYRVAYDEIETTRTTFALGICLECHRHVRIHRALEWLAAGLGVAAGLLLTWHLKGFVDVRFGATVAGLATFASVGAVALVLGRVLGPRASPGCAHGARPATARGPLDADGGYELSFANGEYAASFARANARVGTLSG